MVRNGISGGILLARAFTVTIHVRRRVQTRITNVDDRNVFPFRDLDHQACASLIRWARRLSSGCWKWMAFEGLRSDAAMFSCFPVYCFPKHTLLTSEAKLAISSRSGPHQRPSVTLQPRLIHHLCLHLCLQLWQRIARRNIRPRSWRDHALQQIKSRRCDSCQLTIPPHLRLSNRRLLDACPFLSLVVLAFCQSLPSLPFRPVEALSE